MWHVYKYYKIVYIISRHLIALGYVGMQCVWAWGVNYPWYRRGYMHTYVGVFGDRPSERNISIRVHNRCLLTYILPCYSYIGTSKSGKSTVAKQMRILYGDGYPDG